MPNLNARTIAAANSPTTTTKRSILFVRGDITIYILVAVGDMIRFCHSDFCTRTALTVLRARPAQPRHAHVLPMGLWGRSWGTPMGIGGGPTGPELGHPAGPADERIKYYQSNKATSFLDKKRIDKKKQQKQAPYLKFAESWFAWAGLHLYSGNICLVTIHLQHQHVHPAPLHGIGHFISN